MGLNRAPYSGLRLPAAAFYEAPYEVFDCLQVIVIELPEKHVYP